MFRVSVYSRPLNCLFPVNILSRFFGKSIVTYNNNNEKKTSKKIRIVTSIRHEMLNNVQNVDELHRPSFSIRTKPAEYFYKRHWSV